MPSDFSSMFKKKHKHKKEKTNSAGDAYNPLVAGMASSQGTKKKPDIFKIHRVDEEFAGRVLSSIEDLDKEKEPNELVIVLSHGRNLAATDKNMLGMKSADPRMRFVIQNTDSVKKVPSAVSETRPNTREPAWNEVLRIKLRKPGSTPLLSCYCEDWDIKGVDRMGQFSLAMDEKWKHKVIGPKWHKLEKSPDQLKQKVSGEIFCGFLWWYNPDSDRFKPFDDEIHKIKNPTRIPRPPNELRVACFRGKGLVADDEESILASSKKTSSDPRLRLTVLRPPPKADMEKPPESLHPLAWAEEEVEGATEEAKKDPDDSDSETNDEPHEEAIQDEETPFDQPQYTEPQLKTLRPVWKEVITFQYVKAPTAKAKSAMDFPSLECVVEDVDLMGEPTFLGKCIIPLGQAAKQKVIDFDWYRLVDDPELNTKKYKIDGAIQLSIHWTYNRDIDPHADEPHHNETLLSILTPDFLEDAIEQVVKEGQEMFYDVFNTMVLIADVYEISQDWKLCVDAISVVVGLTPTVNDAISEAQDIASIFIKILAAATGNPAAILHLLYTGYKVLNNSHHLYKLYDESGRFVESMLVIEHFVVIVMDVIARGYRFYQIHFNKMEKKERKQAKKHAKKVGIPFDFAPEWSTKKDLFPDEVPNTLYVGLSRARDLAIKDKYLIMRGGTSDPRMDFEVRAGTEREPIQFASKVRPRTLKPQWNEEYSFQIQSPPEHEILSKYMFGDDHPVFEDPDEVKDPDKDKEKPIPVVKGKTVPEPTLPDEPLVDQTALAELEAKSKKDAQVEVSSDLDPRQRRGKPLFRKAPQDVLARKQMSEWRLYCDLVDVDVGSTNDSLGSVVIDLLPLRNHKLNFGWNLLKKPTLHAQDPDDDNAELTQAKKDAFFFDDDNKDDGKISGEVELLVRWLYEPENDTWEPEPSFFESSSSYTYNEIQVGLFKARELPAMDDNITTDDSSDPYFQFQVISMSDPEKKSKLTGSTTKYQTLYPVYRESIKVQGGPWPPETLADLVLRVTALDYDLVSASDNLGSVDIPLTTILENTKDGNPWRAWHELVLPDGVEPVNAKDIEKRGNPKAEVELFLKLGFNIEPPKPIVVNSFGDAQQTCFSLFGGPPAPDTGFTLEDQEDEIYEEASAPTTHELSLAKKNAHKLKSNLLQDAHKFQELVESCGTFLRNPEHRSSCLDLATALRGAIVRHRTYALCRSMSTQRTNMIRFPSAFILMPTRPTVSTSSPPALTAFWPRGFLRGQCIGGPEAPDHKKGLSQDEIRPTVVKSGKASFKKKFEFMTSLEKSVANMVQDIVNVLELYNDLTRMNSMWNDALKALAFVENTIPKIVSSLEVIQSIIQLILKAIQGISFPPNPAILVDLLHTSRQIFKQAKSVYETYCCQKQLTKSVGILTLFAKALVDAIARCANLLSGEDADGLCGCC